MGLWLALLMIPTQLTLFPIRMNQLSAARRSPIHRDAIRHRHRHRRKRRQPQQCLALVPPHRPAGTNRQLHKAGPGLIAKYPQAEVLQTNLHLPPRAHCRPRPRPQQDQQTRLQTLKTGTSLTGVNRLRQSCQVPRTMRSNRLRRDASCLSGWHWLRFCWWSLHSPFQLCSRAAPRQTIPPRGYRRSCSTRGIQRMRGTKRQRRSPASIRHPLHPNPEPLPDSAHANEALSRHKVVGMGLKWQLDSFAGEYRPSRRGSDD